MKIRSDAADGWVLFTRVANVDVLCPKCSPAALRARADLRASLVFRRLIVEAGNDPLSEEPLPLGGNMVPERLECACCGAEAANPEEREQPSACDPQNDPSSDLSGKAVR